MSTKNREYRISMLQAVISRWMAEGLKIKQISASEREHLVSMLIVNCAVSRRSAVEEVNAVLYFLSNEREDKEQSKLDE